MMRLFVVWAAALGAMIFMGGCRSTPREGSQPPSGATNAVAPSAAIEDRRSAEERAEANARFMAGVSHELNDDLDGALKEYQKAIEADPDNEVMALDLSTRLILLKRYDQAVALLKKALQNPDATPMLDSRLAFVLTQMGRTNEALKVNQEVIRKAPRSILGYQSLFQIQLQAGHTNEARRILEQAGKVANPDGEFLVEYSEMCMNYGRRDKGADEIMRAKARDALVRAEKTNPTNFFVMQKLADGLTRTGERKQAAALLLKIQEMYPDMPTIRERLVDLYLREKDKKGAAQQLEALIRDNPTNPQAYYLLGVLAFDDHDFKEAAELFRKTLLLKPDFEPAYYELAVSKINLDQPREALEILGQARQKFDNSFLAEYFSALAYMRQKDFTNAISRLTSAEVIASATETNRLTHIFYFQLGSACERGGRWQEGELNLRKCLKMQPEFAEALNYLGYMYAEKGTNLVEARQMIEKALKQEPDNSAFLDSLGWVVFKQGQHREALRLIQKAIEASKEPDATLFDHLGDIQAALQERAKAEEAWRKALKIEPSAEIERKLRKTGH